MNELINITIRFPQNDIINTAALLCKYAESIKSKVAVKQGNSYLDAKKILNVMSLNLSKPMLISFQSGDDSSKFETWLSIFKVD